MLAVAQRAVAALGEPAWGTLALGTFELTWEHPDEGRVPDPDAPEASYMRYVLLERLRTHGWGLTSRLAFGSRTLWWESQQPPPDDVLADIGRWLRGEPPP